MSSYEDCVALISANATLTEQERTVQLVTCVGGEVAGGVDTFFLVYSASLVFFMQAGFAMLCAGAVQKKNVQNTMLKNLLDACGAALGFYSVGYAFAYGGSFEGGKTTFIGNTNFFLMGVDDYVFWLFQFAFAATSATIVAGTLAERCQMTAYLCYSVMLSGFVYPVIVHAVWSYTGFLSPKNANPLFGVGMIDFAGSGVVHMTGGITAFIAAKILGARKGRFYDERGNKLTKPKSFPGHSIALQVLGSFILWFGWYGFNVGSTRHISSELDGKIAALAGVNTTLAAAAGGVASLVVNLFIVERKTGEPYFSLNYAMNGCLGGLVCITAGCALIEPWAAIIAGFVAGLLYLWFSSVLVKLCIDDAVDAIPVHMINGFWGLVVTGLFATPEHMENAYGNSEHVGWFYEWGRGSSNFNLLGCQLVGALFIAAWSTAIMLPFFFGLNYLGWFRADALEEIVGLDVSYHGGINVAAGSDIKPEHMDAFLRRKNEQLQGRVRRRRKPSGMGSDAPEDLESSLDNSGGPLQQNRRDLDESYTAPRGQQLHQTQAGANRDFPAGTEAPGRVPPPAEHYGGIIPPGASHAIPPHQHHLYGSGIPVQNPQGPSFQHHQYHGQMPGSQGQVFIGPDGQPFTVPPEILLAHQQQQLQQQQLQLQHQLRLQMHQQQHAQPQHHQDELDVQYHADTSHHQGHHALRRPGTAMTTSPSLSPSQDSHDDNFVDNEEADDDGAHPPREVATENN